MDGNYSSSNESFVYGLSDFDLEVFFYFFVILLSFFLCCIIYAICLFIDICRNIRHRNNRLNQLVDTTWEEIVEQGEQVYNDTCVVCFRDYNNNDNNSDDSSSSSLNNGSELKLLQCGHAFHSECIIPWLEQHNNCPICHAEVFDDLETCFKRYHNCGYNLFSDCIRRSLICCQNCMFYITRSMRRIFRRTPITND